MDRQDRRRFLTRVGTASGAAAFVGVPALGHLGEGSAQLVEAPAALTKEPVLVYVRDAARGEVTVMHGTRESTYRDRALVKRLLEAAAATSEISVMEGR
jgi:hypothetical protein